LKIAFIGQKGIPAIWGGVEEHVEQLSTRLAQRGHDVTVYVRNWYSRDKQDVYRQVKLQRKPSINTKHLDAISHSLFSSVDSLFKDFDIVHYHAIGPAFFSFIPKIKKTKVVATIHRYDYESDKWGGFASKFLRLSEKMALSVPDKTIVVAKYQKEFYENKGRSVVYIPNGVIIPERIKPEIITQKYHLLEKGYLLSLGRLAPEKRVDLLIEAFKFLKTDLKLVIAGGSSATDDYVETLKSLAEGNANIIFTGFVEGQEKEELLSNAKGFVIPSALEGLPIALLEAMSYGLPCIASDILPHKEVVVDGENGFLFKSGSVADLKEKTVYVEKLDEKEVLRIGDNAKQLVQENYNWDKITDQIEKLYKSIV
jgi:glycosyltransferase involved in cell wall biosynthesis